MGKEPTTLPPVARFHDRAAPFGSAAAAANLAKTFSTLIFVPANTELASGALKISCSRIVLCYTQLGKRFLCGQANSLPKTFSGGGKIDFYYYKTISYYVYR